jgi:hypothetical protein
VLELRHHSEGNHLRENGYRVAFDHVVVLSEEAGDKPSQRFDCSIELLTRDECCCLFHLRLPYCARYRRLGRRNRQRRTPMFGGDRSFQVGQVQSPRAGRDQRRLLGCGLRHRRRPLFPGVGPEECVGHLARGVALSGLRNDWGISRRGEGLVMTLYPRL